MFESIDCDPAFHAMCTSANGAHTHARTSHVHVIFWAVKCQRKIALVDRNDITSLCVVAARVLLCQSKLRFWYLEFYLSFFRQGLLRSLFLSFENDVVPVLAFCSQANIN